jgi:protein TonB
MSHQDDKRLLDLLERWQSGDFSWADEQEMQALAASDEFRRETVEGFWALPETDHQAHLAALRTRLRKQNGVVRRVSLPQMWAAIAAVMLLLLTAIWFFPLSERDNPVAQDKISKNTEDQPIASNIPPPKTEQAAPAGSPAPSKPAAPQAGPTRDQVAAAKPTEEVAEADGRQEIVSAPAPSAVESKELGATSPATPREYAKVMDEMEGVDQQAGNMAKRSQATETKDTKSKASKQKKAATKPLESEPLGGWDDFMDYLRRNARLPEAARQNNVSGTVRLQFILDEKSKPINFQTLRSLGYGCDEEAIRLVKGYSWQVGTDPEVTVDVPFVR